MNNFGSFMNDNMEQLLTKDENNLKNNIIKFIAKNVPKNHKLAYNIDKSVVFLNNGAFGLALKDVLKMSNQIIKYSESNPLRYFDRELLPSIAYSTVKIAKFINTDVTNIVLIPNSTFGINCVLNNYKFNNGDVILHFDYLYGATKKNLEYIKTKNGENNVNLNVHIIPIDFPITEKKILANLKNTIQQNKNAKMLILEHISSILGITFPIEKIIKICKKYDVIILADGAHTLGNINLNIDKIKPDIYITNTHKWFGNIKSCSILYVKNELKSKFNSCIVSHGFYNGWASQYVWCGSNNYAPYLTIPLLINIWNRHGIHNVVNFRNKLSKLFLKLIKERWHTELIAENKLYNNLYTIYLPNKINDKFKNKIAELQKLYFDNNIEIPIKKINNKLCIRLSVNVYNTKKDIIKFLDFTDSLTHGNNKKRKLDGSFGSNKKCKK